MFWEHLVWLWLDQIEFFGSGIFVVVFVVVVFVVIANYVLEH